MQRSILKANKKLANELWNTLKDRKTPKGNNIFERVELEALKGFEVKGPYKENGEWVRDENKKLVKKVIFRYTNNPGPLVEWDKEYVTI